MPTPETPREEEPQVPELSADTPRATVARPIKDCEDDEDDDAFLHVEREGSRLQLPAHKPRGGGGGSRELSAREKEAHGHAGKARAWHSSDLLPQCGEGWGAVVRPH